jgi:peptide deformylase
MTKLKIRKRGPYGPLLLPCDNVESIKDARPWIVSLCNLVYTNKLEGLAANQCGINKRVFITDVRGDGFRIFINPTVTITDYDEIEVVEHCSSYRSSHTRNRHTHLIIEAQNFCGDNIILDTGALTNAAAGRRLSAAVQHEMEHLAGWNVTIDPELPGESDLHAHCHHPHPRMASVGCPQLGVVD